MAIRFTTSKLVCFQDRLAPYRGHWVIYAEEQTGRYAACHELKEELQPMRVVESRELESILEARRFSKHLILHGWSPEVIQAEVGYSVLGA